MSIVEAAFMVLGRANRAMSATEVYEAITAEGLHVFKAKQPVQIVLQQIRRHCTGAVGKTASRTKYFARAAGGTFVALPQPITEPG